MISGHSSVRYAILIVSLFAASLAAQDNRPAPTPPSPGSQTSPASRPVLVQLPVFVTDAAGLPVSGLKKNDFFVVENGKPQTLTAVEEFSPPPSRATRPAASTSKDDSSPLVVIAFDLINTRVSDRAYAREQFLRFLLDVVAPGPRVAVLSVAPGDVRVLHNYKTDSRLLTAALRRVLGRADAGPQGSEEDAATIQADVTALSNWTLHAAQTAPPASLAERRLAVLQTLRAWQQLGHALAGVPGRKSVIWTTTGLPFTIDPARLKEAQEGIDPGTSDVLPEYENAWRVLHDANAGFYPVFTGDLLAKPATRESGPAVSASPIAPAPPKELAATLDAMASLTGGRAFYRASELPQAFGQASRDASAYYVLEYPLTDLKPGWRQLDTMVARPNVLLRSQAGFFVTRATLDVNATRASDL